MAGFEPSTYGRFSGVHRGPSRSAGGRVLRQIADAHGATPRQVALRFLVREPGTFTIPRTSQADHAAENAAAGDLGLSDEELARIEPVFPRGRRRRGVPML